MLPHHNPAFTRGVFSIFQPDCRDINGCRAAVNLDSSCFVEERFTAEATQEWLPTDAGVAYHDSFFAPV